MGIEAIDHLYVETTSFERALAFWEALGFKLVDEWGEDDHRAGRLQCQEAVVVLAEAESPTMDVHLRLRGGSTAAEELARAEAVEVVLPFQPTHWGTEWMRLRDPDGHVFVLEDTGTG